MESSSEKKTTLAKWLDTIQQDSWQLELIISGVVIFLMLGAYEPINELGQKVALDVLTGNAFLMTLAAGYVIIRLAYFSLLIIFLVHLTLRGLWIGAVGLRSVSGDFDYEVLDYQPRFNDWLKKQLGSFDDYIERLEVQCSVAFSFAFLIFFAVISVGLYLVVVGIATFSTAWLVGIPEAKDPATWQIAIAAGVNLFLIFIGLLYLIDFSSLGWFKKRRWLLKVYYPFYRLMGWLTLARFYRPFYYNLIDHPFGRILVRWLWLIVLSSLIIASISVVRYDYFPFDTSGESILNSGYYLDQEKPESLTNLQSPSLTSRYATEDYLQVFIPYLVAADDRVIQYLHPGLSSAHTTSFAIDGPLTIWRSDNEEVSNDSLLMAHHSLHRLYLNDSLLTDVNWRFYNHPVRKQPGLVYDLPVYDLPRGEHLLRFDSRILTQSDSLYWKTKTSIPFLR